MIEGLDGWRDGGIKEVERESVVLFTYIVVSCIAFVSPAFSGCAALQRESGPQERTHFKHYSRVGE